MKKLEELRKVSEDGAPAGMTTTGSLPFTKLIAPSTPKSRKRKKSEASQGPGQRPIIMVTGDETPYERTRQWEIDLMTALEGKQPLGDWDKEMQSRLDAMQLRRGETDEEFERTTTEWSPVAEQMDIPSAATIPQDVLQVPNTRQTTHFCAVASLKAVLGFWGVNETEIRIAELAGATHAEGATGDGIVHAAKQLGFEAQYFVGGNRNDIEHWLHRRKMPVILFWFGHGRRGDGNHASVAVGIDSEQIYYMDPEPGMVLAKPLDKWENCWFTFAGKPEAKTLRVGEYLVVQPSVRG